MTDDDILTPADRQVIIKYALDNIRANENEKHFRGKDDNISLYHGESIIQAAIEADLIVNLYSLHDKVCHSGNNPMIKQLSVIDFLSSTGKIEEIGCFMVWLIATPATRTDPRILW